MFNNFKENAADVEDYDCNIISKDLKDYEVHLVFV